MKKIVIIITLLFFIGCKESRNKEITNNLGNSVKYATGLSLKKQAGFWVVEVTNPWPNANKTFTYILKRKNAVIPVEFQKFTQITIPLKNVVLTSTTHIPSIEMLNETDKIIGFPGLNYISSEKVRKNIEKGKIKELGNNLSLNTEVVISLQPSLIVGYGLDNNNAGLDNLQKSGLKVLFNGDWNEKSPLGKAEWIKLFGVLFDKENLANEKFTEIEKSYLETLVLVKNAAFNNNKNNVLPTVFSGSMFQDTWYMPQGQSWGAQFINNAGGNYFWKNTQGTGSLSLSFEKVFTKAKTADIWIVDQYNNLKEVSDANVHYKEFKAFKNKNIYSFSSKKGKTGGVIYYELAPNRPDLVLKDMVKIFHPEVLPNYEFYFFEKLQ